jgi:hypothetical protein
VARSRVKLFGQIRKDRRVEGASIPELADRHHLQRQTVRQALESAVPPPRRPYPQRPRPAIDVYAPVVDGWLLADREVPRKQRHTARQVWQRLVAEHGAACSEVTVSRAVAAVGHRRRLVAEADQRQLGKRATPRSRPIVNEVAAACRRRAYIARRSKPWRPVGERDHGPGSHGRDVRPPD